MTATARPGLPRRSGVGTWFDHHLYSMVASIGRLVRRPWATGLTVGVMAIALALPLGLSIVLANVSRFAGDVQQSRVVGVYLKPSVSDERAQSLAAALRQRTDVEQVIWRSPADGLRELRERGGFAEAIDALESNPLPGLLQVTPRGDDAPLADALAKLPEADLVQHDAHWRERLRDWLQLGTRLAAALAALLGLGALLVVGNTVRLEIQSRREEIEVLQLLGATDGFIRRPFLYLGACYGALAGLLALALLIASDLALRAPVVRLARSYGSAFELQGLDPWQAVAAVVAASLLGWVGAGLVTGHYLRQTRPTST